MSEEIIRKTYLCPIIGSGKSKQDAKRPKIDDLKIQGTWLMHNLSTDKCLVTVITTEETHAKIALDPDYTLILLRKEQAISMGEMDALKTQYPKLVEKLNASLLSTGRFREKDGE